MNAPQQLTQVNQATGEVFAEQEESEFERLLRQQSIYNARTMLEGDNMDKMLRLAEIMADGKTTVPKHLQGNLGDCMAVVMQAMNWNMNAFAVAQKTHLVNGTLGYEAQLVIAVLNSSPLLLTRLDFEWFGEWKGVNGKGDKSPDRGVRVWATVRGETQPRVLEVTMAQVGDVRNSPNWSADPRQQIGYLAAKRWGRLHAPDVILGVYTPDEPEDGAEMGLGSDRPTRNAPPAAVAAAAAPKVDRTDVHMKMVDDLEVIAAEQGTKAFKTAWNKLAEDDRVAIGIPQRDDLLAVAKRTDEEKATQSAAPGQPPQEGGENA